jgi:hypothetical protein
MDVVEPDPDYGFVINLKRKHLMSYAIRKFHLLTLSSCLCLFISSSATADLSHNYANVPVLIENLADNSCLSVDLNWGPYPFEKPCDEQDATQHFRFQVETYVGGIGFVYKVCTVVDPTMCLMHTNNGSVFTDYGQASPGYSYRQIRIQHDEHDAFIEFRKSGKCLEKGASYNNPIATKCDWFGGSPQHYALTLIKGVEDEESLEDKLERLFPEAEHDDRGDTHRK